LGERHGAEELDGKAGNNGWVLCVLLEDGRELGQESADERGDVGFYKCVSLLAGVDILGL